MTQHSHAADPDFAWLDETIAEQEETLTSEIREATGNPDLVARFDRRPLLRTEKPPERKWPDDFRGFGSNVRPRRQP